MKNKILFSSIIFICVCFCASFGLNSVQAAAYEVYVVKAITNDKILPTTYPITSIGNEINITAAPGEYEPASFVVHAMQAITGMQASSTNLNSGSNPIPASAIDIRYVKNWYHSGNGGSGPTHSFVLTPDLLLKDAGLVKVDLTKQINYLRNPDGQNYTYISGTTTDLSNIQPQDAATLQPVDIAANYNQQYWITVQVPDGTSAGTYQGTINLSALNAASTNVPIKVIVLGFNLEKPALIYSIMNSGHIEDSSGSISHWKKSPQQYLAEMKDLKAHGVDYPTFNQEDPNLIQQEILLRDQAGLPKGPFFNMAMRAMNPYTTPPSPYGTTTLTQNVEKWVGIAKNAGFSDAYFFGNDEATGDALKSEQPEWAKLRQAGGKMFVTIGVGDSDIARNLLDIAVLPFALSPTEAQKYHDVGHKVFSYANPDPGYSKDPVIFRRNYGLALWQVNYDGAMVWPYQAGFGSIWDDFDDVDYDYVFAYPTMNGVVDTIKWEGFREGVDDTRYLATLQKAITNSTNTFLKNEAQNWLNSVNTSGDLDAIRATIIDYTTRLANPAPTYKAEDVNQDGIVNTQDLQACANQILGTQSWPRADVNQDGKFDVKDLQRIANAILGV